MKILKPQTLKGFRDFLPQEARKRQYAIDILKQVFESYGFEPLETPALEYEEILTGKYGEEGDKLMYRFEDRGKRKVAMRYDQTVPLARVVAQYGNGLPMPFKRYQIQNVWRAENPQKGRYREFLQCDIDTVGLDTPLVDAEIINVAINAYKTLGFKNFKVLINDRSSFEGLSSHAISAIDKLKKIGKTKVLNELVNKGKTSKQAASILSSIEGKQPTERLNVVFSYLKKFGVLESEYRFLPTLARGLDYYTSTIIEVETQDYTSGSLGGGGRYDNLIGMFAGKQIPAVGFAFGFDRLIEAMTELKLFPDDLQTTKVLVTVFSPELLEKSIEISSRLRSNNINTELYLDENASLEKQLKYADKKGISYAIIIGPQEAAKNVATLRNMKTREQILVSQKDAIAKIKNNFY